MASKCEKCRTYISHPLEDPRLDRPRGEVRELEVELAQTKLAHVEAECRNQVNELVTYPTRFCYEHEANCYPRYRI